MVDREVCALELKYEIELSNYLKAFLPESFSKPGGQLRFRGLSQNLSFSSSSSNFWFLSGDSDAILLTIRCSRLSAKTAMLTKLLNLKVS